MTPATRVRSTPWPSSGLYWWEQEGRRLAQVALFKDGAAVFRLFKAPKGRPAATMCYASAADLVEAIMYDTASGFYGSIQPGFLVPLGNPPEKGLSVMQLDMSQAAAGRRVCKEPDCERIVPSGSTYCSAECAPA